MKILIAFLIALILVTSFVAAVPLANKGSEMSAQKVSEKTKIVANQNAAFNRNNGECVYALYDGLPVGPYLGASFEISGTLEICGWVFIGSNVDFRYYLNREYK